MSEQREYWPVIEGGRVSRRFRFVEYRTLLFTDIHSPGTVQYLYVMAVFKVPENKLCLCIASEENSAYKRKAAADQLLDFGASHFLGLFPGQEHLNFGSSNDWANLDLFSARALELARGRLKVSDEAIEEVPRKP